MSWTAMAKESNSLHPELSLESKSWISIRIIKKKGLKCIYKVLYSCIYKSNSVNRAYDESSVAMR